MEQKQIVIARLKEWALKRKDVKYVMLTGSAACGYMLEDEYSDIDAVVFSSKPDLYEGDSSWIHELGEPVSVFTDLLSQSKPVKRICFSNRVSLDIFFVNTKVLLVAYLYALVCSSKWLNKLKRKWVFNGKLIGGIAFFTHYIHRGFYGLVDKKQCGYRIAYIEKVFHYNPANDYDLKNVPFVVNKFWQLSFKMAISIYRKELLLAKVQCEDQIKHALLYLIELHTKSKRGAGTDTWHKGKFINLWADSFITNKLTLVYGRYDADDAWRSLSATMDLFSYIVCDLVTRQPDLKFDNPEKHFRTWIEEIRMKSTAAE